MTSSDPTVRQLLASAVDDHPIDLEARLGGIHEPSGRKPPLTRLLVGVAALAIAAAAVALVVWTFAVDRSSEPANLKRNGVIAFLAHHPVPGFSGDLGHTRIVTMNPDGTNVRVLRDVRGSVGSLSWSPDGSRLVFSNEARNFGRSLIDVMRADGDRLHPIRTCPTMVCLFDPAWSPRGDRIAFEQGADVFTITATGRDVRRLAACTSTKPADSLDCYGVDGISWSPDGKQIVFARRTIASHLFLVQSNGRGLHQITACGSKLCLAGEGDGMPAWSPDGRQIAFQRERNIFVVRPDGSGLRQVTRCPHVLSGNSVTCEAGEPAWAPDGTKIVFRGIDGLYVMNADGTHQRRIGPRNASSPAWAPQAPSAVKPTPSPKPIETI